MEYNEDGSPKRDFPVTLVKGDQEIRAYTEADVVSAEWNGFSTKDDEKVRAQAEKASAKQDSKKSE